ncbi:penicillin-binding protein [Bacillus pakistanensis]|uniref:serine-type D-Ala-D-Ala carboxypeptidase n=1 Tax=Rossellomorea pakistanensis TaxID=992288 RepID=A0ABS2ND17_9BACI|nr:penicillin-binding transpeptidase domain-containing protein [Bacillus pakistanensis]MBM7585752.1 penicillin-binding protein [Bacillus pakistanensis]
MKKVWFLLASMIVILALSACQEKPQPDDRLQAYTDLWNKQKFEKMYDSYLTSSTTDTFKKEDFVKRYKDLYKDLEVDNLKVTYKKPQEDQDFKDKEEVKLPITIEMKTLAGEINYEKEVTLTKEKRDDKEDWYIQWDTTFILPNLEEGDKVRIGSIPAKRGEIFDRNGEPLAVNGQAYEIGVVPQDFNEKDLDKLSKLLETTPEYIQEQMGQSWVKPSHLVPLKKYPLTQKEKVEEIVKIGGVLSPKTEAREYPYAEATAHLIGHLGNMTAEKYEKLKDKGYSKEDRVGIRGLEQLFEEKLRGQSGKSIYIEKEDGETETITEIPVKDGENMTLTIDAEMQKTLYQQMKTEAGTATAIHPKTGEVLSLLSTPSYDPNEFVLGISSSRYKALEENPKKPLLNRFSLAYSPGSTMKGITSTVALNNGLDPNKTFSIPDKQWQKDSSWGDYKVTRVFTNDSSVDLESALKFSDNIYFAQIGLETGDKNFVEGLKKFGFGEEIPFTYPITASQVSNNGKISSEIQLADSAFGQGEILMSVLHLANSYCGIINDGTMMKPILLDSEKSAEWKTELLSKEHAELLKTNFRKVVTEGIAGKAAVKGKAIAGKTGTAEIKSEQGTTGTENGSFVSYDQNNPNMVLAILLEDVAERGGSTHTVEVTKRFYESWK